MTDILLRLFGEGRDLDALQMGARAVVVFILVLVMVRVAGRRSFGRRTSFDHVVAILLGAIVSRAIVGVSPFVPTIVAAFVLVLLHRALAWLNVVQPGLDALLNGRDRVLFENGRWHERELRRALIHREDVLEGVRLAGESTLDAFREVRLERSGRLSLQKRR
ncbi:DUF421 domain-containing protein [Solimonas soli]|uniref:DUF421 domain-containing protein n=1 Tax=Solimonas soli TaxID=413479 RepID=UPI0004823129|nr:DUF421 domain-containing protein [Solimonas soli]